MARPKLESAHVSCNRNSPSRGSKTPGGSPTVPSPYTAAGSLPSSARAEEGALRVLLGHADPHRRHIYAEQLRDAGFHVEEFDSGFDLLGHTQPWVFRGAAVDPPDAIVCGDPLAEWSCADVLRVLRAGNAATPFVVVTEASSASTRARWFALGADAIVVDDDRSVRLADSVRAVRSRLADAAPLRDAA